MLIQHKILDSNKVLKQDRVKTKSGRHGTVLRTFGQDTAIVQWDDGETFPIRAGHLEVLAHNSEPVFRVAKTDDPA